MKALTTAGLVAALAMGALAGTATTAGAQAEVRTERAGPVGPEAYDPPPIEWGRCDDRDLRDFSLQCGSLPVPLDYSEPDGETITLALSRLRPNRNADLSNGVMLLNPGGPGASGLFTPFEGVFFARKIERSYDWVSWDPRGVGASTPRLECRDGYFGYDRPDFVPESPEELTTLRVRAFSFAAHCQLNGGSRLLDHIKTSDNVADMEVIRRALDSEKLNFYGFSYGSLLGQVYATRYPQKVGRMVLDGVADPRRQPYQGFGQDQNTTFNANINRFFAWVAENDEAYGLGTSTRAVRRTWYRLRDQAREEAFGGKIGSSEWTDLFLGATYSVDSWRGLARRLQETANGDYAALVRRYETGDSGYPVYLATICTDAPWPSSREFLADARRQDRQAPFATWQNTWYNAPCLTWPAKPAESLPEVDGSQAPPILLTSETYDAATPYSGALEVRSRFPRSALVEGEGGASHSVSTTGTNCTFKRVSAYLRDGTLPERVSGRTSDAQCPGVEPRAPRSRSTAPEPAEAIEQMRESESAAGEELRSDIAPEKVPARP